ncbi:MAG: tetratricopeptide repeat protein [Planctomycetota bacterium]|jgi:tetratricopeptide (TPR) repeat protein
MKAEHRHELKTNELAQWIANLPQWTKQHLTIIIIVSVVVVLGAGSFFYFRYQRRTVSVGEQLRLTDLTTRQLAQNKRDILAAQGRGLDLAFVLLQLAGNLQTFANGAKSDDRAALALIKRGDALRAELHYRAQTVSKQDVASQAERAKNSYNDALEKAPSNPTLKGMAHFGIGLCEEELGNFQKAEQIYSDLVEKPEFEGTTVVVQARQRLETMGDYRKDVVFRVAPRVVRPPTTMPRIPFRLPDVNTLEVTVPEVNRGSVRADTNLARVTLPISEVGSVDTNVAAPDLAEADSGAP